jgi:NAD-dependent DNA ligase
MTSYITQFLDSAAKQYYEGNPIISDAEFDFLAEKHKYTKVGATPTEEIPHLYPMFSLKKSYLLEEIPGNFNVKTPKLDGAAISLLYVGGRLRAALTRGDGKRGNDITDKMLYMATIPPTIPYTGMIQITGEIVTAKDVPNARNYASGALALKDFNEFMTRELYFVPYDCTPSTKATYTAQLQDFADWNFFLINDGMADDYPTDGWVYRIDSYTEFLDAGFTSHHPKGAIALKDIKQGVKTTLIDVTWQVGRTGVVTPVAIFDEVVIDGAKVNKATLHNYGFIESMGLEIGSAIEVIRSGEIIPKIINVLSSGTGRIIAPTECPSCKENLILDNMQLFCHNKLCPDQGIKEVLHFAKTLKIKGLGEATAFKLGLSSIKDIYSIADKAKLEALLGSKKVAEKLYNEILKSLDSSIAELIPAFGIPLIGKTAANIVSQLDLKSITINDCIKAGLGPKASENLVDWVLNEMPKYDGIPFNFSPESKKEVPTKGVVCITGKLNSFPNKDDAEKALLASGYKVSSTVTKSVTILVNESGLESSKTKNALEKGIKIITNLMEIL